MPIQYKSLNQLAYESIHAEILDGKLSPGTRIKQEELTERLGVSRTPVREALRRLGTEGLIQFVRRNVAIVSAIPRKRIEEIFELRILLEGHAAERASEVVDQKALEKMRRMIQEMDASHSKKQIEKLLSKNAEFHRYISSLSGNETLIQMLEMIWRDIRRLRIEYLYTPEGHQRSVREHKELVNALESKDKKVIRKVVHQHSQHTMEGILDTLESAPEKN